MKVLVVEDDLQLCSLFKLIFKQIGVNADIVNSFEEAIKLIQAKQYDIVITDYELPDVNGDQLAKEIKKRSPNQIVIGMSGNKSAPQKFSGYVDKFIQKPFNISELSDTINISMKKQA